MDSEKKENNNVEDGYESLPQDVVKALMESHPIHGNGSFMEDYADYDSERESRRNRRKKTTERELEKTSSFETVKEGEKEKFNKTYIFKNFGSDSYSPEIDEEPEFDDVNEATITFDVSGENEDMVQLVRHKALEKTQKKASVTEQPKKEEKPKPAKKEKNLKLFRNDADDFDEDEFFEINSPEDSRRALDNFFAENDNTMYEYEEKKVHRSNIVYIVAAVAAVFVVALLIVNITTSGRLAEANKEIATLKDVKSENEELKLSVLTLEEKVDMLEDDGSGLAKDNVGGSGSSNEGSPNSSDENTYTVVEGDSFWLIAQKVYGNGAEYKKILEANHLTENSPIRPGETLKIPE